MLSSLRPSLCTRAFSSGIRSITRTAFIGRLIERTVLVCFALNIRQSTFPSSHLAATTSLSLAIMLSVTYYNLECSLDTTLSDTYADARPAWIDLFRKAVERLEKVQDRQEDREEYRAFQQRLRDGSVQATSPMDGWENDEFDMVEENRRDREVTGEAERCLQEVCDVQRMLALANHSESGHDTRWPSSFAPQLARRSI